MDKQLYLGRWNRLKVVRYADFGFYLDGGREGRILLPKRYVPEGVEVGDEIDVFLYLDQEERLIATTEEPLAQVGDFAYLKVSWVNEYGAFLDWGLMKDLFCPFREQKKRMEIGNSYIVYVDIDRESYRIMASAKVERFFDAKRPEYKNNDEVDLLVWQKTELGFKVIVDNRYAGLVYDKDIYRILHTGDRLKGYIKAVIPDGKIDVALQPTGRKNTEDFAEVLLLYIKNHDGFCYFNDNSSPEAIKQTFHVSKKTFKRAVGDLYKKKLITIEEDGLRWNTSSQERKC